MFNKKIVPIKLRLLLPVGFIIIAVISLVTSWFIYTSINTFNAHIEKSLELKVTTISKMFERESILKLKNVQTNLKVINHLFYSYPLDILDEKIEIDVENQKSGQKHKAFIRRWKHNNTDLYDNSFFVDKSFELIGGTISVFQKIDSGFVRVATNVKKADGSRAVGTYIPNNSPVVESITKGNTYFGRAIVVNEWYTTAYEPIIVNNEIVGMVYVGDKEKDLEELKKILYTLKIGKSGYPFVFDRNGYQLIHPTHEGETWSDSAFLNPIRKANSGIFYYRLDNRDKTIAFTYFEKFELYIGASIISKIENKELIRDAILGASAVGLVAILFLLGFIYYFTTERIYKFMKMLQVSNKKLADAELALKQSEKLATMGQISAGIAHELNNPLGVITMYSNIILDELKSDDPHRKDVQLIVDQADRCKGIVSGLLNFARKNKVKLQEINIKEFIERSLKSVVIPQNVKTQINLHTHDLTIMIDSDQMMQVFTNLEKNACEAMPDGGILSIDINGDDKNMVIKISDTGTGIVEENLDKLFTPFFTTKEIGKGTGLGLPLVYGIVKMHKGKIDVSSNADSTAGKTGTTFTLTLPRVF
ncbi:MAG: Cache 3/Cache 2 fusion domain-containing protein [Bacteroidales bacterium]